MSESQQRRTDAWHFEKRLSLDTLVALVGVAVLLGGPFYYWANKMDSRVQTLEVRGAERDQQEAARALDARDARIQMLGKVDKLDEQVTQLRVDVAKLTVLFTAAKGMKQQ